MAVSDLASSWFREFDVYLHRAILRAMGYRVLRREAWEDMAWAATERLQAGPRPID